MSYKLQNRRYVELNLIQVARVDATFCSVHPSFVELMSMNNSPAYLFILHTNLFSLLASTLLHVCCSWNNSIRVFQEACTIDFLKSLQLLIDGVQSLIGTLFVMVGWSLLPQKKESFFNEVINMMNSKRMAFLAVAWFINHLRRLKLTSIEIIC